MSRAKLYRKQRESAKYQVRAELAEALPQKSAAYLGRSLSTRGCTSRSEQNNSCRRGLRKRGTCHCRIVVAGELAALNRRADAIGSTALRFSNGVHNATEPFGAQLRYLISAGHAEKTVIGCLQYSSAAWRMAARDQWIGWDDETRGRKLQQVVNNSRFLILPWVRVKNLASRVLSVVAGQMARDWEESYGVEPLLIETLVDGARYAGVCYRAANWIELGVTSGRGRMDGGHQREGVARKKVFVYPLAGDARERLRES